MNIIIKFLLRFFLLPTFIFLLIIGLSHIDHINAQTINGSRAQLEAELADLEKQITAQQNIIATTQAQGASLSRDISVLQAKINEKQLQIKKISSNISTLSSQISDKSHQLNTLSNSLNKQKSALAESLRNMNVFDGMNNLINLILDNKSLSDYFEYTDKIVALQDGINKGVTEVKTVSQEVTEVRSSLEENKDIQIALKNKQALEESQISSAKKEKNTLLSETKGQEALYKKQLAEKQAKASQIRAALFSFAGGETKAIPFGDALKYAEAAQSMTGVPAAFVLAILTQESALGANVGKCYLSDTTSGAGYNINTKTQYTNVMKASRDIPGFLKITSSLGMDPLKTVVSCPIPSAGGYGGAMGPAQFIPSTWLSVASRAGATNPWNARDAIFTSSTYLSDLGASSDYTSQVKAACRYYGTGGSTCSYGKSVLSKVAAIQNNIDYIKQYGR